MFLLSKIDCCICFAFALHFLEFGLHSFVIKQNLSFAFFVTFFCTAIVRCQYPEQYDEEIKSLHTLFLFVDDTFANYLFN